MAVSVGLDNQCMPLILHAHCIMSTCTSFRSNHIIGKCGHNDTIAAASFELAALLEYLSSVAIVLDYRESTEIFSEVLITTYKIRITQIFTL